MKPPKLMSRILGALQLQPMTLRQLAQVLSCPFRSVRALVWGMVRDGYLVVVGLIPTRGGRPKNLYAVNSACGMEMCAPTHDIPKWSAPQRQPAH